MTHEQQLDAARARMHDTAKAEADAKTSACEAEAAFLRLRLAPILEANPGIERIEVDTYPEYNDEGGTYEELEDSVIWAGDEPEPADGEYPDDEIADILREVTPDAVLHLAENGSITRSKVLS